MDIMLKICERNEFEYNHLVLYTSDSGGKKSRSSYLAFTTILLQKAEYAATKLKSSGGGRGGQNWSLFPII